MHADDRCRAAVLQVVRQQLLSRARRIAGYRSPMDKREQRRRGHGSRKPANLLPIQRSVEIGQRQEANIAQISDLAVVDHLDTSPAQRVCTTRIGYSGRDHVQVV
jgi:hypothetical protein